MGLTLEVWWYIVTFENVQLHRHIWIFMVTIILHHIIDILYSLYIHYTGIIQCMRLADEKRRYSVTPSLSGWTHTQNGPRHDDVMKWKHFPRYWRFVRGIPRSPANYPHKGQWHGAFKFSLICALNKRMSKQSWGWWFETLSRSLWRHCNDNGIHCIQDELAV